MSAFLFIQDKRKTMEKIDFVIDLRLAMNAPKKDFEKQLERWAKNAEIDLRWED